MKEYFFIGYKKDNEYKEKKVKINALAINLIELQNKKYEITDIEDNFNEHHDLLEMLEIFKESIDIEYEDVESKLEAYNLAFNYFEELYKDKQINKRCHDKYIKLLNKYNEEIEDVNEFIENVKKLYVS